MERLSIDEAISNFKLFHKEDLEKLTYEEDFLKRFGYTKERLNTSAERNSQLVEWLEELKAYRDAEEQGLLLRLKLKVGDEFWELNDNFLEPAIYPRKAHSLQHVLYCMDRLGKVTFLTKEEAEQKLESMKGE